MKVIVAGEGAFGVNHLKALQNIEGAEVVSLAGGNPQDTADVAK